MLVNLKEILAIAEEKKCAVGAFNTPNLECLLAVIDAAQKLDSPVIISHKDWSRNGAGGREGRRAGLRST